MSNMLDWFELVATIYLYSNAGGYGIVHGITYSYQLYTLPLNVCYTLTITQTIETEVFRSH
jgi:hypothetical protein